MKYKKTIFVLLTISLILSLATIALARAGGGHSSRSSSSSSSHSSSYGGSSYGGSSYGGSSYGGSYGSPHYYGSSGSGGGGLGLGMSFLIFVVVIGIIGYNAYKNRNTGSNFSGDSYSGDTGPGGDAPNVTPAPDLEIKLQEFKVKDPGFNDQVFQDKVSTSFFEIQRAWSNRDMTPARPFISDSVNQRFTMQLQEYVNNHTYNKLDELSLDRVEILDIRSDGNFDTIDIWITATARDYVMDENGKMVSPSRDLTTWDEKWSLVRSGKTKTILKAGVQTYQCPNCGSPAQFNAIGECEYCHSMLTKFDFDWVLSEITQLNM